MSLTNDLDTTDLNVAKISQLRLVKVYENAIKKEVKVFDKKFVLITVFSFIIFCIFLWSILFLYVLDADIVQLFLTSILQLILNVILVAFLLMTGEKTAFKKFTPYEIKNNILNARLSKKDGELLCEFFDENIVFEDYGISFLPKYLEDIEYGE